MDESTTTEEPKATGGSINGIAVDDQGMAVPATDSQEEPQPEAPAQTEAVAEPTEPEQKPEAQSEPKPEKSEEDQLAEWAEKKGLKLDSENATKAAKMAREAEKAMHQKAQRASELEKNLSSTSDEIAEEVAASTGQDPELLKRVQRVEVRDQVRDFWDSHPEARALEADMITELQAKPHLAGDLESLYATVVYKKGIDTVKKDGGREALSNLAQKQQAAVPRGNAVNSGPTPATITPQNVDSMVASHDLNWFKEHQNEINKAMAA